MSETQPGQVATQALEQAKAEINGGNNAAAVTFIRQAVGRADTSPDQLAEAGRIAATLGMEEAFTWLMRAGRLQLDGGHIDAARATLLAARQLDEKNYEPVFELGRVEIAAGNKAEGLGRFAEVLRKSNYTFVPALFEAGRVYEDEGSTDQAILTFRRIVERDKSHAQALAHLGRLHRSKQMAPEATTYLLTAAEAARKVMDYALALQCARDILAFDPANARASGLESEMLRVLPEHRERPQPAQKDAPKTAPPPPPPPVQQVAATIVPPDFKLIEQQSKATLELAQVTAAVAEAYKSRLAIEEQMKQAQAALESVAAAKTGADQELTAIKQQLDNVTRARAAEEATLAALSAKLEHTRTGLTALETLHESVKQADAQRLGVVKAIDQLLSDAGSAKDRAEKAKAGADAIAKQLAELTASSAGVRKEADAAKAALDASKAQVDAAKAQVDASKAAVDAAKALVDEAKADAATAEKSVEAASSKFDAAKAQYEVAVKNIAQAATRAHALGSDASAALSSLGDAQREIDGALAAQKSVEDAIAKLRQLAAALTERRKQTETALTQIQGMGEPQTAGLGDSDIAKLEAGLAAAIEKAAATRQAPPPPTPATPAPAAAPPPAAPPLAAPTPAANAAAAVKPNGTAPSPPVTEERRSSEDRRGKEAHPVESGKDRRQTQGRRQGEREKPADDKSPQGVFARASALLEANKPQDALKLFESLQANPEFAVTGQTAIGRCLARVGKIDDALQHYSKALETPGYPEEQYHEALYCMADAHESRDDAESRELALWALEEIAAGNAGYRDVAARIESLKAQAGKAPTGPA
jgi:hypothetical protein